MTRPSARRQDPAGITFAGSLVLTVAAVAALLVLAVAPLPRITAVLTATAIVLCAAGAAWLIERRSHRLRGEH